MPHRLIIARWPEVVGRIWFVAITATTLGAFPTWKYAGREGLYAEFMAALIAVVVSTVSIYLVLRRAKDGPGALAAAFVFSGLAKVIACIALAALAWWTLELAFGPLMLWLCLFYAMLLITQGFWLVKVLRRSGP